MGKSISAILLLFSLIVSGQENYPKDYFRSPMDIPIILAGTFGDYVRTIFIQESI